MIVVIAVFYVLLALVGAAIVRPVATMTMIVFKGAERENRKDVSRGRRRGVSATPAVEPEPPRRRRIRRRTR